VSLVLYNVAYLSEIIRSAAQAIPADNIEAARAFGFTRPGLYVRIVLPQVAVNAAPVIGNQLIMMIKDTALLMIITVQEISFAANFVNASAFSPFAPFTVAVLLYWGLCLVVEAFIRKLGAIRKIRYG
jgi:polar amino acid transport system permease protein